MQSQFFDQQIHLWRWTGNETHEALLRPALASHAQWAGDCFDADGKPHLEMDAPTWRSMYVLSRFTAFLVIVISFQGTGSIRATLTRGQPTPSGLTAVRRQKRPRICYELIRPCETWRCALEMRLMPPPTRPSLSESRLHSPNSGSWRRGTQLRFVRKGAINACDPMRGSTPFSSPLKRASSHPSKQPRRCFIRSGALRGIASFPATQLTL
jgi:hypothetical protein